MRQSIFDLLAGAFISSTFFISRSKEDGISNVTPEKSTIKTDMEMIRQLGFSTKDSIDLEDYYLVEGDIALNKKELRDHFSQPDVQLKQGTDRFANGDLYPEHPLAITIHSRDSSPLGSKFNIQADKLIPNVNYNWKATGGVINWESGQYVKVRPNSWDLAVTVELYADNDLVISKSFMPSSTNVSIRN